MNPIHQCIQDIAGKPFFVCTYRRTDRDDAIENDGDKSENKT